MYSRIYPSQFKSVGSLLVCAAASHAITNHTIPLIEATCNFREKLFGRSVQFASTIIVGACLLSTLPDHRILKYAGCSEETFILALIYMDQIVQFNPDFVISSLNVHRLLITSIMVRTDCLVEISQSGAC